MAAVLAHRTDTGTAAAGAGAGPVLVLRPPSDDLSRWIAARMDAIEAAALGAQRRKVGLIVRERTGAVVAGVTGHTLATDFYVHLLWVDKALRGTGLGRTLMLAAERLAAEEGCRRIFLNTMAFQAPGFYAKLGYALQGAMPDFVWNSDRLYYRKAVSPLPVPELPDGLRLDRSEPPTAAEVEAIENGLDQHWYEHAPDRYALIGAAANDGAGGRAAGATGVTDGEWFTLVDLWVEPEARGKGLGTAMLAALEDAARAAGCNRATAMPMAWQTPDFFARRGYAVALHLDDYVLGRARTWFRKRLDRA